MKKRLLLLSGIILFLGSLYCHTGIYPGKKERIKLQLIKSVDIAGRLISAKDSIAYFGPSQEWFVFDLENLYAVNTGHLSGFSGIEEGYPFSNNNLYRASINQSDSMMEDYFFVDNFLNETLIQKGDESKYLNTKIFHQLADTRLNHYIEKVLVNYPLLPDKKYPVENAENLAQISMEFHYLFRSLMYLWQDRNEQSMNNLMLFLALRKSRWDKDRPYLAPYEQNYEMRNGLKRFKSAEMYRALLDYRHQSDDDEVTDFFNNLFNGINEIDYLFREMGELFYGNCIKPEYAVNKRLEMTGYIQSEIFHQQGWLKTNLASRDLWYILNDKVYMSDSTYKALLIEIREDPLYQSVLGEAQTLTENYKKDYDLLHQNFNQESGYQINLHFKQPYKEFGVENNHIFIQDMGKYRHYENQSVFVLKTKDMLLEVKNKNILKISDDQVFYLWHVSDLKDIYVDNQEISQIDSLDTGFSQLSIKNQDMMLRLKRSGHIKFQAGNLEIKINPVIKYQADDFYWSKLEELMEKLISGNVSEDWFIKAMNHQNFKTYYNMRRYFVSMPEHRVSGDKKTQTWYDDYFGLDQKIDRGNTFLQNYKSVLEKAELKNGIHYELIMAILSIESDYGNNAYKGTFYTFPALVSQYLTMPKREKFAVNEIKALADLCKLSNKDTYHFIGSFAGA